MERRRISRRTLAPGDPFARARLRAGGSLMLIDGSTYGALAETAHRLLPGRNLDVHLLTPIGRVLVRSRVTRAFVWTLAADAIRYRAALAFEHPLDLTLAWPLHAPAAAPRSGSR